MLEQGRSNNPVPGSRNFLPINPISLANPELGNLDSATHYRAVAGGIENPDLSHTHPLRLMVTASAGDAPTNVSVIRTFCIAQILAVG